MKESYKEDLANYFGFEPCAVDGNIGGVASVRGNVGQLLNSAPFPKTGLHFRVPILSCPGEGNTVTTAYGKVVDGHGGVTEPVHAWTFQARPVSRENGGRSH